MSLYFKVAICDDEKFIISEIENMLFDFCEKLNAKFDIDVFFDGEELIESYQNGKRYDLLYLDIEMKKLNGIKTAKIIRVNDKSVLIVYISGYDNHIKELFEVEPFRFISKPIDKGLFYSYLKDVMKRIVDRNRVFTFQFNKDTINIPIKEILYFESNGGIVRIVLEKIDYKFYRKLDEVEEDIEKNYEMPFIRIHKSYLVNYLHIRKISLSKIELTNGKILNISEKMQKKVRNMYSKIIMERDDAD